MPTGGTKHTAFIKENFGTVWPVHLVGFTRLLVQLRAHFHGDLDLMLVLAVIGSRTQDARWNAELAALGQLTRDEDARSKQLPINIQSISEFTGIPRETVRRKLVILEQKGWVSRNTQGHIAVTQRAGFDLEVATGDTITYLAALVKAVETAQSRAGATGLA